MVRERGKKEEINDGEPHDDNASQIHGKRIEHCGTRSPRQIGEPRQLLCPQFMHFSITSLREVQEIKTTPTSSPWALLDRNRHHHLVLLLYNSLNS